MGAAVSITDVETDTLSKAQAESLIVTAGGTWDARAQAVFDKYVNENGSMDKGTFLKCIHDLETGHGDMENNIVASTPARRNSAERRRSSINRGSVIEKNLPPAVSEMEVQLSELKRLRGSSQKDSPLNGQIEKLEALILAETDTQDRSKRRPSIGPAGSDLSAGIVGSLVTVEMAAVAEDEVADEDEVAEETADTPPKA